MGDADPRALERVGAVLNEKWTLERLIGVGGMGAVYAGRHRNGARAAVKVLHPDLARLPVVRERFLREGYAANSVEHRGAVQVLDDDIVKDGPDEGSAYLVMELLEGESLDDRAEREPKLTERDLLEVMDAVLDVLVAAHEHGVIHRDLKPENIFLAKDPDRDGVRVKVLDFGLARLAESATVTSAGIALGTPSFMSPEQAGGGDIDGRTDIFGLGATAFRIYTERRIHDASNLVALVVKMATQPAPKLRTITPDASEPFARVIDRALAFSRDDRYPDAKTMQADVRAALGMLDAGEAATLQLVPFSARNVPTAPVATLESDPPPPPSPPPSARPISDPPPASDPPSSPERSLSIEEKPRGSSLPYLLIAIALGLVVWKFGPNIQAELVRMASLPARSEAPPSDPPPVLPPPPPEPPATTTTVSAPIELEEEDAAALTIELDASMDDAGDAGLDDDDDDEPDAVDGGETPPASATNEVKDATAPPVARATATPPPPRPKATKHPNRPPRRPGRPHKRRR